MCEMWSVIGHHAAKHQPMIFPVGKQCKHVLKIKFTLLLEQKSVLTVLQMLLKFPEVHGLGVFMACGPWT